MLVDNTVIDQELAKEINSKSFDRIESNVIDYIYDHHNVPKDRLMEYVTLRKPIVDMDLNVKFAFFEAIIETTNDAKRKQKFRDRMLTWFTELERGKFSVWKYDTETIPDQFHIPCIQVSENQWIGATDVHFFIQLREAQKIRYNENAQRIMKRINKGNSVEYAITVNWSEVKDIQKKLREESFIPNAWTLNIPEDVDTVFYYDSKNKELIFDSITVLDITDGYHRYLAASAEYDRTDGKFNYPVEIRIINFSDKKARDFVYQETLGMKMRKVDAQAMNSTSPANFIVDKINEESNLEGLVKRNGGLVNYSSLSYAIQEYYYEKEMNIPRSTLVSEARDIIKYFNKLTSSVPELLDKEWDYTDIISVVLIMKPYIYDVPDNNKKKVDLDSLWKRTKDCLIEYVPRRSLKPSSRIAYKYYSALMDEIYAGLGVESN